MTTGEPTESKTFTYGNAKWKDQLTAVDGTPITYDAIGNPLNDGTWTYTWQNGRQLASMSKSGTTASFKYNENGLRVQKTVNGVTTDYTLHGKNIVHMKQGSNNLHFFYDAQSRPAVVVYNGTAYSYVKNLQGDIVAILNSAGTAVVCYTYDAWGRPISKSGTLASTLGTLNPFRYRSYTYDEETELYYLGSRYYSFKSSRYINADSYMPNSHNNSCYNLYHYCGNNPIVYADPDGREAIAAGIAVSSSLPIYAAIGTICCFVAAGVYLVVDAIQNNLSASESISTAEKAEPRPTPSPTPTPPASTPVPTPAPGATPRSTRPTPAPEPEIYYLAFTVSKGRPIHVGEAMTLSKAHLLIEGGSIVRTILEELNLKGNSIPNYGIWTQNKSDARRLADTLVNKGVHYEEDNPYHLPHFHCATDPKVHIWFER